MANIDKRYYLSPMKVNGRTADTVIEDDFISFNDSTYVRLSRAPKGRSALMRLRSVSDDDVRIVIYK